MSRKQAAAFVCLAAVALGGCAETLVIRSYPPGARASVDGTFVGVTPATVEVPRERVKGSEIHWKLEKDRYESAEGLVKPRIAPGRIVGGVFTLGILLIFRSPYYLPAVTAELAPVHPAEAAAEPVEQRLEKIEQLHRKGLLSDAEYTRLRQQLLDELGGAQP